MDNKKSILFINYFFPPIHAIGSIRNYNVAKFAADRFSSVHVLSTTNKYLYAQNQLPQGREKIVLLPTFDFQTVKLLLQRVTKKKVTDKKNKSSYTNNIKFLKRISQYPLNLLIGEGGFIYILFGIFYLLFNRNKFDVVYSSYSPHSDHFLAFFLKKINPRVIWVADFRDIPFVSDNEGMPTNWEKIPNNRFIQKADLVTSVSDGLSKQFKKLNESTYTLRNGISDHLPIQEKRVVSSKKFTLTYTGGLYGGIRTAKPIFQSLRRLIDKDCISIDDIQVNYAGKDFNIWRTFAEENNLLTIVNDKGTVSHRASIDLQKESQVNILLSWATKSMKGILTGKFYEYLSADRPIVLVINGEIDHEFERIFKLLNAGIVIYTSSNTEAQKQLDQYILALYQEWKENDSVESPINKNALEDFKWSNLANKFYDQVDAFFIEEAKNK